MSETECAGCEKNKRYLDNGMDFGLQTNADVGSVRAESMVTGGLSEAGNLEILFLD